MYTYQDIIYVQAFAYNAFVQVSHIFFIGAYCHKHFFDEMLDIPYSWVSVLYVVFVIVIVISVSF